jgi:hypothetical protein
MTTIKVRPNTSSPFVTLGVAPTMAYTTDLGAVTGGSPVTITHNLGTFDVAVQVVEKDSAGAGAAAGTLVDATVALTSVNALTLTFTSSAAANLYRVTVLAVGGSVDNSGVWNDYNVLWTATSNPTLGDGTLWGRYTRIGNTVHAVVRLAYGTTTTPGTGGWVFSLPVASTAQALVTGAVHILDGGTDNKTGVVIPNSSTTFTVCPEGANQAADGSPMTWAYGDSMLISVTYEAGT